MQPHAQTVALGLEKDLHDLLGNTVGGSRSRQQEACDDEQTRDGSDHGLVNFS